jgi:hypothetical protein
MGVNNLNNSIQTYKTNKMDFLEQLKTQGIPVDVNIDIPDKTLVLLGVVLFAAILLALVIAGVLTHLITKRIA